jgi:hypothetical protein
MGCGMRDYHASGFRHDASRMVAWTSQVSLKKASPSRHLVSKPVASLSCTAALVSLMVTLVFEGHRKSKWIRGSNSCLLGLLCSSDYTSMSENP